MKANKIFAMAAFAATTILAASCSNADGDNPVANGTPAKMGLTIEFPKAATTRAVDANATAQDLAIGSVTVFIFEQNGSPATGNGTTISDIAANFTQDVATGVWALNDANRISTSSGAKRVYVGVNLPASLAGATSESELINGTITASSLYSNTSATQGPAMISPVYTPTVAATYDDATNLVASTLNRMMAKLTVKKQPDFSPNPTEVPETNGNPTFTVVPVTYTVGNIAKNANVLQKLTSGTPSLLLTPGDGTSAKATTAKGSTWVSALSTTAHPYQTVSTGAIASGAETNALYIPEHSTSTQYLRSESTAAIVRGELTPKYWSSVNASNTVVATEIAAISEYGDAVYVIKAQGGVYFAKDTVDRNALVTKFNLTGANTYDTYTPDAVDGKLYTYYWVFVNRTPANEANRLEVRRNSYYKIGINHIITIGQPDDTDDNDDEPVFETPATLDVSISVADWNYQPAANQGLE